MSIAFCVRFGASLFSVFIAARRNLRKLSEACNDHERIQMRIVKMETAVWSVAATQGIQTLVFLVIFISLGSVPFSWLTVLASNIGGYFQLAEPSKTALPSRVPAHAHPVPVAPPQSQISTLQPSSHWLGDESEDASSLWFGDTYSSLLGNRSHENRDGTNAVTASTLQPTENSSS